MLAMLSPRGAQGVKVLEVEVQPLPLTGSFLAQRVEGFSVAQSQAVFQALRDGGALNETGHLFVDPRCALALGACALSSGPNTSI